MEPCFRTLRYWLKPGVRRQRRILRAPLFPEKRTRPSRQGKLPILCQLPTVISIVCREMYLPRVMSPRFSPKPASSWGYVGKLAFDSTFADPMLLRHRHRHRHTGITAAVTLIPACPHLLDSRLPALTRYLLLRLCFDRSPAVNSRDHPSLARGARAATCSSTTPASCATRPS